MRRLSIPLFDNPEVQTILDKYIPKWSELNKDHRTLIPFLINAIISISKDISEEHRELLSRFHLHLLPEYEPAYLFYDRLDRHPIKNIREIKCTTPGVKEITDIETFMTDTFNALVERISVRLNRNDIIDISVTGRGYQLLTKTGTLINTTTDINSSIEEIQSQWDSNPIKTLEVFESSYVLIPGVCRILSVVDEYNQPISYEEEEHTGNIAYDIFFDLNGNGIIDPEDIATIREYVGIAPTADNIDEWNNKFNNFDINKNGVIDLNDIRAIEKKLWAAKYPGKLITSNRKYALIKVTYREITEPGISSIVNYNNRQLAIRTNTYGSSILAKQLGRVATIKTIGLTDRNDTIIELHESGVLNLVRTIGESPTVSAISWPEPWIWKPVTIETIDGILILFTQNNNTVRSFIYDLRMPEIAYSDSYIDTEIEGTLIASSFDYSTRELLLLTRDTHGLVIRRFSLEKNYWFYSKEENRIYTTNRYVEFTLKGIRALEETSDNEHNPDELLQPTSIDIVSESIPLKIQNSIDDYMYNWGMERTPGSTNRECKEVMRGFFKHLQGNSLQGMYYGIARMLGFSDKQLEDIFNISDTGIVYLSNRWYGHNPVAILVMDETDAHLYSFKYAKFLEDTGTVYIETPVELDDNRYYEFYDGLIPSNINKHFADITATLADVPINIHDRYYEWELPGIPVAGKETDRIKVIGNMLDLTECSFLLENHTGKEMYVIYDTSDSKGNHIRTFIDKLKVPRYRNHNYYYNELPFYIEALSDTSTIFSRENLYNMQSDIINKIIASDNSRWKDTTADLSYFNTTNRGGQKVRPADWSYYWS
jgi:hypothetical protein